MKGIRTERLEASKENAVQGNRFRKKPKPSNLVALATRSASEMNARPSHHPVAEQAALGPSLPKEHNVDSTELGEAVRDKQQIENAEVDEADFNRLRLQILSFRRWRRSSGSAGAFFQKGGDDVADSF